MKLEITDAWLLSFDEKIPEPSGYITPNERAVIAKRREGAQTATIRVPRVRKAKKANDHGAESSK